MDKNTQKKRRWHRRKRGVRKQVRGTPQRPRLSVYRSVKHIYAQVIDDLAGHTLVTANSRQSEATGGKEAGSNVEGAHAVGQALAERARSAGITRVAFDRNGFHYHGRVRALADAAREGGLEF